MHQTPESPFLFCPRCGASGFSPGSDNYHRCRTCSFRLYTNAASAVMGLIEHEGRLLLTRRAREPEKGTLDLPGGFVDILETAEAALVREIKEELNLHVVTYRYFTSAPNRYLFSGLVYFTLDLAFVCGVSSFEKINTRDDVDGYELLPLEKVNLDDIGLESAREVVSSYISSRAT